MWETNYETFSTDTSNVLHAFVPLVFIFLKKPDNTVGNICRRIDLIDNFIRIRVLRKTEKGNENYYENRFFHFRYITN